MSPFLLVGIGFLLILIEFYVPGAIMGISGGILILISIILFAIQDHSALDVAIFVMAVIVSFGFLISFILKRIPKAKPGISIYLNTDQEGYQASEYDSRLIGKYGIVLTDLKPSGHILIEGKQYQALSRSEYLAKGSEVVVMEGRGAYFIVKQKE